MMDYFKLKSELVANATCANEAAVPSDEKDITAVARVTITLLVVNCEKTKEMQPAYSPQKDSTHPTGKGVVLIVISIKLSMKVIYKRQPEKAILLLVFVVFKIGRSHFGRRNNAHKVLDRC